MDNYEILGQLRVGHVSRSEVLGSYTCMFELTVSVRIFGVGRLLNAAFDAVSRFRALPSAAVLDARRARRSRPRHGPHAPFLASARVLDDVPRGSHVACRSRPACTLPYPAEIRRRPVRPRVAGGNLARPFLFGARYRGTRGGHVEPDGRRRGTRAQGRSQTGVVPRW